MSRRTDLSDSDCSYGLDVRTRLSGGSAVLTPCGEIDHESVRVLDAALEALSADTHNVVLNMAEVAFMDSAGLHFLERLNDFADRRGVAVAAVNWLRQPRRLLELGRSLPSALTSAGSLV
ncbi:STAS domain-containing protein [Streptomyces sp. NPDC051219]|uniref:STAS domain-containing protein n=1 Tax=Streptomyces sp. NPDC051219 TaxID=3155283 RepID=UPI00342AB544